MTPEEEWAAFLNGTHPHLHDKSPLRFIPSNPRCKLCAAPFGSPGRFVLRRYGFTPWEKNPNICGRCFKGLQTQAQMCPTGEDGEISGAEVELSMLFADVRGSSKLARAMPTLDFSRLMNRFYKVSKDVLVDQDAIIEKYVGDEVVGLFIPVMTGPEHARHAIDAATELLRATGHGSKEGPWVPLGAGVHTGRAFVGVVGSGSSTDFTALGDPVNTAARLAGVARAGEILVSSAAAKAANLDIGGLETRSLDLRGRSEPLQALVLGVAAQGAHMAPR